MRDRPLIINVAPTGAISDPAKNPHVPITLEAVVADVAQAAEAGASIAHLHIRDAEGKPSCDSQQYGELFARLRKHKACAGLILGASTSGRHGQSLAERAAVLHLPADRRPEMASLTLGDVQFPQGVSCNSPADIRDLASTMRDQGVKPELEIFELGMLRMASELAEEGVIRAPYFFNFILGNCVGLQPDLAELAQAFALLPPGSLVSLGGIGRKQFYANALGVLLAAGVRVGLEDNLWSECSSHEPATNPGLVRGVVEVARTLRRPIATRQETRAFLEL